jgi:hypothetical protein
MTNKTLTQRIKDEIEYLNSCSQDSETLIKKAGLALAMGGILANSILGFYNGLTNQPCVDENYHSQAALVGITLIGTNIYSKKDRVDDCFAAICGNTVFTAIAYCTGKFVGGILQ